MFRKLHIGVYGGNIYNARTWGPREELGVRQEVYILQLLMVSRYISEVKK